MEKMDARTLLLMAGLLADGQLTETKRSPKFTDNRNNWRHNLETEIARLESQAHRDKYAEKRLQRKKAELIILIQEEANEAMETKPIILPEDRSDVQGGGTPKES